MIQEHIFVLTKIAKIILSIQIPVGDNCYYVWIVTSHGHEIADDFCHYKNAVLLLLYYSVFFFFLGKPKFKGYCTKKQAGAKNTTK